MLGSVFAASFSTSWRAFVFFYGFIFPIGIGLTYWVPIMSGWEWFPDDKAKVAGFIVAGFGFGAFIFGFVTTGIVNPENK